MNVDCCIVHNSLVSFLWILQKTKFGNYRMLTAKKIGVHIQESLCGCVCVCVFVTITMHNKAVRKQYVILIQCIVRFSPSARGGNDSDQGYLMQELYASALHNQDHHHSVPAH